MSAITDRIEDLERKVAVLDDAVQENRRLNERLSDLIDVVSEVLVPALDRDDARVQEALQRLDRTLS